MSLFIDVLVKKDIQILAMKPKSYAFHHRSPSRLKTEEKRISSPDYYAMRDEFVERKVRQKGLTR
jgi:hypothetical protein